MLLELDIKNLVIIEKLKIEFGKGLNVLTGETGAGKSILLDALGLILGNRADTSLIRQGEDSLCVCATFNACLANKTLCDLCSEYELELDDEIIIKRTLHKDGKGKILFNDQQISVKLLKELSSEMLEINGQFASQGLLNSKNHISFLDAWGKHKELSDKVKSSFEKYKDLLRIFEEKQQEHLKIKQDEELIAHFADELEKLAPQKGEEEHLQQRRKELMNAEKIAENFNYAYQALSGKTDICGALRQALSFVDRNNRLLEDKYADLQQMLENAMISTTEVVAQIENISQNLSFDASEQNNIEERLFALKAAARKHNVQIDDLPDLLEKFRQQLRSIDDNSENLQKLLKEVNTSKLEFLQNAKELSKARKSAADKFSANVMAELAPLKMDKAEFVVKIDELGENQWNENGIDNIEFCVSTNPNSPLGSIDKIASGGELSRIMLAIKLNLADSNNIGTIIFDEIDSGISGATAEALGERLALLGKNMQVLAVTHSAQVAAKSNQHFKVEKIVDLLNATTKVRKLSAAEKAEEIARIISGENISNEARAAAKILIGNSCN